MVFALAFSSSQASSFLPLCSWSSKASATSVIAFDFLSSAAVP